MSNLFPEILGIEAGQDSELAHRIVDRIKVGNPQVVIKPYVAKGSTILNLPSQIPTKSRAKVKWQHAKKALIIRQKGKLKEQGYLRFLHVFVAVGDVVEEYQFTLSIENECPYSCQFCYVQASLGPKPIPTIFTNVQDQGVLLREIKIALLAMHMHTQTHGINYNIGWEQKAWVHDLLGVLNTIIPQKVDDIPVQTLFGTYKAEILEVLSKIDLDILKPIIDNFDNFDFTNLTDTFKFNCGEINDALVFDHLTDNSKFLVDLFSSDVMKKDGAVLLFRTKSTNFDNLKVLTPSDNIKVSVTILPQIFVFGPPSHVDRLKEANKLLKLGFQVSLNIDPIILVEDYMGTYKTVVDDIKAHFEYKSSKFGRITIGMLRFGEKNLVKNIRKRHQQLNRHANEHMTRVDGDEKYRYDRDKRVEIYKVMVDYIRTELPGVEIELSTEPVDVWKDVGLTWD